MIKKVASMSSYLEDVSATEAAGASNETGMRTRPHVHFPAASDLRDPDAGKSQHLDCLPGFPWHAW